MADDFFRGRLDQMIDLRHPLAVLSSRMPWGQIETALKPFFARQNRSGKTRIQSDLFGEHEECVGAGISPAGRPRLSIRLMASLLYLKHAFNLSNEALIERWTENVVWQYFSGQDYYTPTFPCDATQLGRFRRAIGEAGVEELLKATIDTAAHNTLIAPTECETLIVDTTVQEKAILHPTDTHLLEVARKKLVEAAQKLGVKLKQTYAKEGAHLRLKAGRYAHAKQFKRMNKAIKRQRTILGIVHREMQRKVQHIRAPKAHLLALHSLLAQSERLRTQQPKDKDKLYALHAPEVECIGKGKARKPYEFGVKTSLAVTHKSGLIVGARTFPGNPYDGHTLSEQIEQTRILLEDIGRVPKTAYVDLGYRAVETDNPHIAIIHRGKYRSLTPKQRRALKRRSAIEPVIGHVKADHRMNRCHLKGERGDALHTVLCAAGYNIAWLLRAIAKKGLKWLFLRLILGDFLTFIATRFLQKQIPTKNGCA